MLTTGEAARELRISPEHVRRLANAGALPVARTAGRMRLFRGRDVARLARRREREERVGA